MGPTSFSKISETFDQPTLENLATSRNFVQQQSGQQLEQLPRPRRRPVIPCCTGSVASMSANRWLPALTLQERREILHDALQRRHWRRHFVLNLTTLWRLRLHVKHAVHIRFQTLYVSESTTVNRLLLARETTVSPSTSMDSTGSTSSTLNGDADGEKMVMASQQGLRPASWHLSHSQRRHFV